MNQSICTLCDILSVNYYRLFKIKLINCVKIKNKLRLTHMSRGYCYDKIHYWPGGLPATGRKSLNSGGSSSSV